MKAEVRFKGKICSGSDEYKYIGLQESLDSKGQLVGINVLLSPSSIDFKTSHDVWVASYSELVEYLKETAYLVQWV